MKKVYLFEDHDRSLDIWRKNRIKWLDLVHVDAHIDFGFHEAQPPEVALEQASSVEDLKKRLECGLAYRRFQKDLSKQVDIGNYIYPAMLEGMVGDFYWVVPGGSKEFVSSRTTIVAALKRLIKIEGSKARISFPASGVAQTMIFGRKLYVCTLESLPVQKKNALLDIDADFLVIESAKAADNTTGIGERKPWISPGALAAGLRAKVARPKLVTIAYSCHGGYTPMKYRYLGDLLAYLFDSRGFENKCKHNLKAALLYDSFLSSGKKDDYRKAARLNPVYRSGDNNYGPLYLMNNKDRLARKEFVKINEADPGNPGALSGLGLLALKRNDLKKARGYFSKALASKERLMFKEERASSLLGLAQVEYKSKNFSPAKRLLLRYRDQRPLEPSCRYLLGAVYEKEGKKELAARYYSEAVRLGIGDPEVLYRLAKISFSCKEKGSIIEFVKSRVEHLKTDRPRDFTKKENKLVSRIVRLIDNQ